MKHAAHNRIDLLACTSRGIINPHEAEMQCCGAKIDTVDWPPGWPCEYLERLEQQHPFMACLEWQHEQALMRAVIEGASWL